MDNHKMQELIRVFDEKMSIPDPPHGYMLRCLTETTAWIKTLDAEERASVFTFIGYILERPRDVPLKTKTLMLLKNFPCRQTEDLLDKVIEEGISKHEQFDLTLASDIKKELYDRTLELKNRCVTLKYREQIICFFKRTRLGWEQYAVFHIPPEFSGMEIYDLYMEGRHPIAILTGRGSWDIAAVLDEKNGKMLRWHPTK